MENPQSNVFANDGSFFDQFRKKMAGQSKTTDLPSNPNCQKHKAGFKLARKPINMKASLKKQLKNDLSSKGTLETKEIQKDERPHSSGSVSRFSKDWKPKLERSPERVSPNYKRSRTPERRKHDKRRSRSSRSRTPDRRRSRTPDRRRSRTCDKKRSRSRQRSSRSSDHRRKSRERKYSQDKSSSEEKKRISSPSEKSSSEKSSPSLECSDNITPPQSDPTGKRKRKSRWGEKPADLVDPQKPKPLVAMINGVPVVIPSATDTPEEVTLKALASLVKKSNAAADDKNKYEYDSDEDIEEGTWEHKLRAAEIETTNKQVEQLNSVLPEGKHHLGDFLPTGELERFMTRATAIKNGKTPGAFVDNSNAISSENIGFKMLQKAGWKEGSGLGASGSGIVQPIDRGMIKPGLAGLGTNKPDEPLPGDNEFDIYRKRMMLAYKFRPNPMKNPRRAYY